jgi:hypothetical protein
LMFKWELNANYDSNFLQAYYLMTKL